MHNLGIHNGADLKQQSVADLVQHFGKVGHFYYKIARAEDDRIVEPNRIRKSIGAETSFTQNLSEPELMNQELEAIAQTLQHRLERYQVGGRTITLKVKFGDYQQITRSKTLIVSIREANKILLVAKELFEAIDLENRSIRLLGISLSNLDHAIEPIAI
jgi:DNA polymerase-4